MISTTFAAIGIGVRWFSRGVLKPNSHQLLEVALKF
jgi:hypothetical protein